jgi:hypothetical protein
LAEQRNGFVSTLTDTSVLAHAHAGSTIDRLYSWTTAIDKQVFSLNLPENASLMQYGVAGYIVPDLVECLLA